jgi:hypothetical protein
MKDMAGNEIEAGDRFLIRGGWNTARGVPLWFVGAHGYVLGIGRTRVRATVDCCSEEVTIGNEMILIVETTDGRELVTPRGQKHNTKWARTS